MEGWGLLGKVIVQGGKYGHFSQASGNKPLSNYTELRSAKGQVSQGRSNVPCFVFLA